MTELIPSTKLSPEDFTNLLYPYAKNTENTTGISAIAILAQAALESGWNSASIGWAYFGVKWNAAVGGDRQLITTTEYMSTPDAQFPVIESVTPIDRNGETLYKYIIQDWFRKYDSPEESFTDHADFFLRNPRYSAALDVKDNPEQFFIEIAKAGYATDTNYAQKLISIANRISGIISDNNLS